MWGRGWEVHADKCSLRCRLPAPEGTPGPAPRTAGRRRHRPRTPAPRPRPPPPAPHPPPEPLKDPGGAGAAPALPFPARRASHRPALFRCGKGGHVSPWSLPAPSAASPGPARRALRRGTARLRADVGITLLTSEVSGTSSPLRTGRAGPRPGGVRRSGAGQAPPSAGHLPIPELAGGRGSGSPAPGCRSGCPEPRHARAAGRSGAGAEPPLPFLPRPGGGV